MNMIPSYISDIPMINYYVNIKGNIEEYLCMVEVIINNIGNGSKPAF